MYKPTVSFSAPSMDPRHRKSHRCPSSETSLITTTTTTAKKNPQQYTENHGVPSSPGAMGGGGGGGGTISTATAGASSTPLSWAQFADQSQKLLHDKNSTGNAASTSTGWEWGNQLPSRPGIPVVYRTPEQKQSNPERLNLDGRNLPMCPMLEGEEKLRLLNLQRNQIVRIEHLIGLRNLIFLDLYDNAINDMSGLDALPSLRVLMLGKNRIKRISGLGALRSLDILDLHSNSIRSIDHVSHLSELRILNLADNAVDISTGLAGLESLTELNLKSNKLRSVVEVDMLPSLQRLFVSNNQLSSSTPEPGSDVEMETSCIHAIFGCSKLTELSIEGNLIVDSINLLKQKLLWKCSSLRQLDGRRVNDDERRIAQITAKRDEDKRLEAMRQSRLRETRTKAISQAELVWSENKHPGVTDTRINGYNPQSYSGAVSPQMMCRPKSSFAEIDGTTLHIYGAALEALDRTPQSDITTLSFKFVDFENIVPLFVRLRVRFPSLTSLMFSNTNINSLRQLNQLSVLRRLDELTIKPDDNRVTCLSIWRLYIIFRLAHLNIQTINGEAVTLEERRRADRFFSSVSRLSAGVLTSSPASVVGINLPISAPTSSPANKPFSSTGNSSALLASSPNAVFCPPAAVDRTFAQSYVDSICKKASNVDEKLQRLDIIWPDIVHFVAVTALQEYEGGDLLAQMVFDELDKDLL